MASNMASPAFIMYPNKESTSLSPRSPTPVEHVGASRSRIPIRSTSLPSLTHRFRRSMSIHSRKNITVGDAPPLDHSPVSKYSQSKSLSDFIPHLPKMTLTLGSGLFPNRSKIPQRSRRDTGSVFYEHDGMAESDSEEERSDQTYMTSCYPMSTLSPKELDVHIPETSLWEEIHFPDFDDESSRVHAFSFIPDAKPRCDPSVKDERHEAKPQAVLPVAIVEDELEWTDLEQEDVNLMRELLLGNLQI
ncbi:hypothetical protein BDZ89DRAFT_1156962 [Hymenopellis radicata]|nr:hypothetical protein BDZ89DRAFT_1156962 [Hymenopellis radicata]